MSNFFFLGCKLLFKQDFIKRLGLKCVSCNHCNQLCKKSITRQFGGTTRDFCSETCAKKFHDWFYKVCSWHPHLFKEIFQISFESAFWKCPFLATRRRGVTVVRSRVTWQSLWCGEQRWNSFVTKIVCWSFIASRTSPSWSLRKAQRTPA